MRFLFIILSLSFVQNSLASDCSIAKSGMKVASEIRGLSVKSEVPCKLQNKEEVKSYIIKLLDEEISSEELEAERIIYQVLGFIPLDYDYKKGVVELYTAQVGGYYDARNNYYVMASWIPISMQTSVAVHELVHALQDQHYNLDDFLDPKKADTDEIMARSALIEGDASAVMTDYSKSLSGSMPLSQTETVSPMMLQSIIGAAIGGGMTGAPATLQSTLIFPYVSGLQFVHKILLKGGYKEVGKAYSRLPRSTEEILHPEKYFSGKKDFREISKSDLPTDLDLSAVVKSDRLGEFFISALLGAWLGAFDASQASEGWGGDRVYLLDTSGKIVWITLWDTEPDAIQFFDAVGKAYSTRFKVEPKKAEGEYIFPTTPVGKVEIRRERQKVVIKFQPETN